MNNSAILWILVLLLVLFLVFAVWKKGKVKSTNYKGLFYLGLVFTVVGLIGKIRYNDWAFLPIGVVFLLVGWVNRDKWKKSKK